MENSRAGCRILAKSVYNIDQCAEAIHSALEMPLSEQIERMRTMRSLIKEFNVYRWAGKMLNDASRIRHRNRLLSRLGDWSFPRSLVPTPS